MINYGKVHSIFACCSDTGFSIAVLRQLQVLRTSEFQREMARNRYCERVYETSGLGRFLVNCVGPFTSQCVIETLNELAHKNADMILPTRKA